MPTTDAQEVRTQAGAGAAHTPRRGKRSARALLARLRPGDRTTLWRWAGDLGAVALLLAVLVWLEDRDGGTTRQSLAPVAALALTLTPLLVREAARLPRWARAAVAAWGLGAALSLALALDRSGWVPEMLALMLFPAVLLAALRLWRRRWGPALLAAIAAVSLGAYWHRSFLQWWGHTMLGAQPRWMALSWHNQSGILMGGFGLLLAGLAMSHRRVLQAAATLAAGGALAGAWLSSSRGAVLFTALGAAVLAVAAVRARAGEAGPRPAAAGVAVRLGAVAAVAALVAGVLLGMFGGQSPLASRTEDPLGSFTRRFLHMEAAAGMALARPLSGTGPGSYAKLGYQWTRPSSNLTASAHNEYVEAFAEEGALFGLAVLALAGAVATGVVWTLRRPPDPGRGAWRGGLQVDDVRAPLRLGMAGAATALAAHAAIDFDWSYLVLAALLLVCTAGLVGDRLDPGEGQPHRWWTGLVVLPAALLLAAGIWGNARMIDAGQARTDLSPMELATGPVGWDTARLSTFARRLSADGQHEAARRAIDRALRWSPGVPELTTIRAIVDFEAGAISAAEMQATLRPQRSLPSTSNMVARSLIDSGRLEAAREVLAGILPLYPEYREWGVQYPVHGAWKLLVEIAALEDGCDSARVVAAEGALQPFAAEVERSAEDLAARAEELCARLSQPEAAAAP